MTSRNINVVRCDVAVIGGGAAGFAATLAAREMGAKVILLEKCSKDLAGGDTRVSGGGWFINSDPRLAEVFLRSLNQSFEVPNSIVTVWAQETANNTRWLERLGAKVLRSPSVHVTPEYSEVDGSKCYGGMDTIEGHLGNFAFYDFMEKKLRDSQITVLYDTPAKSLIRDRKGSIIGVIAEQEDCLVRVETTGGVVLATGGFAGNARMTRDYLGLQNPAHWGSPACTGDGLTMALEVGADLWHMHNMATITGFKSSTERGFYLSLWCAKNFIFVDKDGRRFMDESQPPKHGHTFKEGQYQLFPRQDMFVIFDRAMMSAGPLCAGREALPVGWTTLMERREWSKDNTIELEKGWIAKADTIEGLADRIGVSRSNLMNSVDSYNTACTDGCDRQFGRPKDHLAPVTESPFFGILSTPLLEWSNGGPRRDENAQVLRPDGSVIHGLFAAGIVSSTYSWRKDGGFHMADALAFGRIAGERAATRALREGRKAGYKR